MGREKIIDLVLLDFIYNEMLLILFLSLTHSLIHSSHQVERSTCEQHGHTHKNTTSRTIDRHRAIRFFFFSSSSSSSWYIKLVILIFFSSFLILLEYFSVVLVPARREISYFPSSRYVKFFFAIHKFIREREAERAFKKPVIIRV